MCKVHLEGKVQRQKANREIAQENYQKDTYVNCIKHITLNEFQNATCTKQLYKVKIEKYFMD